MIEILDWIDNHLFGIVIFFLFFGGAIGRWIRNILVANDRRALRAERGRTAALRTKLEAAELELSYARQTAAAITGSAQVDPKLFESAATAARMARLLGIVQGADAVVPQLPDGIAEQINAELDAYHTVPVPKALEGPKGKKGKKA
jgi:hypothetical protein